MSLRTGYHWTRRFWRPSRQQRLVLDALVEGRTNPEIAALLDISLDGAKWHVGHLFEKTDCETRQELARWWLDHRERYERGFGFAPLLAFGTRGAGALAVVAVAASIVGVALLGLGRGGGKDISVSALTTASPQSLAAAAAPAPTPTATPPPRPGPGAWVFDIRDASVTPLPGMYFSRRWLDPAAMTFVPFLDPVVIDLDGTQALDLDPSPSSSERAFAYPDQARGNVILWWAQRGVLSVIDPRRKVEVAHAGFGPDTPLGERAWDVSAQAGRIALTEAGATEGRVVTYQLDGSGRRELYRGVDDTWPRSLAWSPDGNRLLVRTGTRAPSFQLIGFVVVDATTGRELVRERGSALWAGAGWLLASRPGEPPMNGPGWGGSYYIDVATGAQTAAEDTAGLLCVSPNSRYGIFFRETTGPLSQVSPTSVRVKDLTTGATLKEAQVARNMTNCDWTWDSLRVVLSPGGK
jgi:DNA-binding CsgD family transcriptional regulator